MSGALTDFVCRLRNIFTVHDLHFTVISSSVIVKNHASNSNLKWEDKTRPTAR